MGERRPKLSGCLAFRMSALESFATALSHGKSGRGPLSRRKRNRLHADSAIGASYRDATGTNAMTEPATIGHPSVSKPTSRS